MGSHSFACRVKSLGLEGFQSVMNSLSLLVLRPIFVFNFLELRIKVEISWNVLKFVEIS